MNSVRAICWVISEQRHASLELHDERSLIRRSNLWTGTA